MYRIVEFDRFFRINDLILAQKKPSERINITMQQRHSVKQTNQLLHTVVAKFRNYFLLFHRSNFLLGFIEHACHRVQSC